MMWRWLRISLLVLCGAIALGGGFVHWRSHRVSSVGHWYGEKSWVGIYCSRGRMVVGIGREHIAAVVKHDYYERPIKPRADHVQFDDSFHGGQWLGIGYFQSNLPTVGFVLVPIWLIWGLAVVPLGLAIFRGLKKRVRQSSNLCINCGFDLRGSSGRCPECGQDISCRVGLASPL
jgi:hypothetical protein